MLDCLEMLTGRGDTARASPILIWNHSQVEKPGEAPVTSVPLYASTQTTRPLFLLSPALWLEISRFWTLKSRVGLAHLGHLGLFLMTRWVAPLPTFWGNGI